MKWRPPWLLIAIAGTAVAGEAPYLTKKIGGSDVKLPLIGGMIDACARFEDLAARAASLTPSRHDFLTCLATPAAAQALRQQTGFDAYPFVYLTQVKEQKGGPLTEAEFAQVEALSKKEMESHVARPESSQQELDRQDQAIAVQGGTLKRKQAGMELGGFFDYTREYPGFTYVVTRTSTVSEAGASQRMCEVNVATMLLVHGRMLSMGVIDHCEGSPADHRARQLARSWLEAFESLNDPR